MEENIQFMAVTKDGEEIKWNSKAATIFQAAFELLESIALGDLNIDPQDIVKIIDIPG